MTSEDNWEKIIHYEIHPKSVKLIDNFENGVAPLATGQTLQFIPIPFCSAQGSFMTYDAESQVLFSGDLFSGLSKASQEERLYAQEEDWEGIRQFHQRHIASSKALRNAIHKINALDPKPSIIAPQHGMILRGKIMEQVADRLYHLQTGVDLLNPEDQENIQAYVAACNEFIQESSSYISMERISQKLEQNTKLWSNCTFKNGSIKQIFRQPQDLYEKMVMTIVDDEDPSVHNQLKSFALKVAHSRGLPAPDLTWESDPTLTTSPAHLFDEKKSG